MFKRRTIPEARQPLARSFVLRAIKACRPETTYNITSTASGARDSATHGGHSEVMSDPPEAAPMKRYELRCIRQMMFDLYGA